MPVWDTVRNAIRCTLSKDIASAAIGLGELCRVHAVPDDPANATELARAQIPQPSFYLVRPDGYIGLCGAGLEAAAVKRYLSEHLHMKA